MEIAPETDSHLEETQAVSGSNSPIGLFHRKVMNPSTETLLSGESSQSGLTPEGTPVPERENPFQARFKPTEVLSTGFIP